jgi:hypothetical protein
MKNLSFGAALFAAIALAGCGSGGGGGGGGITATGPAVVGDVPIPNFSGPGVAGSFDLAYVDQANHVAYFTDRNNKSVDEIIYASGTVFNGAPKLGRQFSAGLGFTGCQSAPGVAAPGCPSAALSATNTVPPAATANSGPNGLHGLVGTTTLTAGDVQKIVVFNSATGALIATIPATNPIKGNTGARSDEGCVLPAAKSPIAGVPIAAYSNTSEGQQNIGSGANVARGMTYYTFVRLDNNTVIGQLVMPNSAGQELCLFDTTGAAAIMYYTDDGDIMPQNFPLTGAQPTPVDTITGTSNPSGNVDALHMPNLIAAFAAAPASLVNGNKYIILDTTANVTADIATGFYAAGATAAGATYAAIDYKSTPATGFWHRAVQFDALLGPVNSCGPAGMALNTNNNTDVAISCRPPLGQPLTLLVANRNTGAIVSAPLGGGADQVQFDAVGNGYLTAASRWTPTGLSPNSCAATPATRVCSPVLSIVDATNFAIRARVPIGNNAHGMDFDSSMGLAFLAYSNSTLPAGCGTCAAFGAAGGGGTLNGGVSIVKFR